MSARECIDSASIALHTDSVVMFDMEDARGVSGCSGCMQNTSRLAKRAYLLPEAV